ncbi:MAG: carboxypeptidase-like regulatory domain-containing protein [Candidatus Zixiibacteriota bacterium]
MGSRSQTRTCLLVMTVVLLAVSAASAQFSISGTVLDHLAAPVANVEVFLYDDQGNPIGMTQVLTDGAGFYTVSDLPEATYGVEFVPPGGSQLLPVMYTGIVVNGNVTLDVTLQLGYSISGTVTDGNGFGIPDIDLNVYEQATGFKLNTPGDNTDATGAYDILVPAGTFRVRWRAVNGEPLVPVEMENVVIYTNTVINVTMQAGFFLSGTVLGPSSQPVVGADIDIVDAATNITMFTPSDNTDALGGYQVIIPPGTYDVIVEPVVLDRLLAAQVSDVTINADTTLDFSLSPGYSLSGYVRNSGGTAVPSVDIDVSFAPSGPKIITPSDITDAAGLYQIIVPAGLLNVAFTPPPSSHLAPAAQYNYAVSADAVLDMVVPTGVLVTGTVTDGSAQPVAGVDIDARVSSTGTPVLLGGDRTDAAGHYQIVVVPGVYDLQVEPLISQRLVAVELRDVSLMSDTPIATTLEAGALVSGTVTDAFAQPLAGVDAAAIIASSGDTVFTPADNTNLLGQYGMVVPLTTLNLEFYPPIGSGITDTARYPGVVVTSDRTFNASFAGGFDCCQVRVGDANQSGEDEPTIGDVTVMIDAKFITGSCTGVLPCLPEADINLSAVSQPTCEDISIGDITILIDYLFITGPALGLPSCP